MLPTWQTSTIAGRHKHKKAERLSRRSQKRSQSNLRDSSSKILIKPLVLITMCPSSTLKRWKRSQKRRLLPSKRSPILLKHKKRLSQRKHKKRLSRRKHKKRLSQRKHKKRLSQRKLQRARLPRARMHSNLRKRKRINRSLRVHSLMISMQLSDPITM